MPRIGTEITYGAATAAKQDTQIESLQLIDDLRNALGSVNTDDLQIDVKTSALPSGAATEDKQDTQITYLQLIDDLRNALNSIGADKLDIHIKTSDVSMGGGVEYLANTFVNAVVFDTAAETYTSASLNVQSYRRFLLSIDLTVTGAPTDIVIRVQFSDDDTTYRNLMNGPFGDLRYEDAAGNKNECVVGEVPSKYMRIYVVSSGCDATNKFTLTVKAEFKN